MCRGSERAFTPYNWETTGKPAVSLAPAIGPPTVPVQAGMIFQLVHGIAGACRERTEAMQKNLPAYRKAVALMLLALVFCYIVFYGEDTLPE